jgi:hypothetical protein
MLAVWPKEIRWLLLLCTSTAGAACVALQHMLESGHDAWLYCCPRASTSHAYLELFNDNAVCHCICLQVCGAGS